MYSLELTDEEKIAFQNLLKDMNWYRLMDLLSPYYLSNGDADKATNAILRISRKLDNTNR